MERDGGGERWKERWRWREIEVERDRGGERDGGGKRDGWRWRETKVERDGGGERWREMEVERALASLLSLLAAQPSLCRSCASLAPPPVWFAPPCLAPAFPLFLGYINASLHPMAPFVLTEHPRSSQAARLLQGAVLPGCLFPTQAQGAQTKSEFNRGLGRLSRQHKGHSV